MAGFGEITVGTIDADGTTRVDSQKLENLLLRSSFGGAVLFAFFRWNDAKKRFEKWGHIDYTTLRCNRHPNGCLRYFHENYSRAVGFTAGGDDPFEGWSQAERDLLYRESPSPQGGGGLGGGIGLDPDYPGLGEYDPLKEHSILRYDPDFPLEEEEDPYGPNDLDPRARHNILMRDIYLRREAETGETIPGFPERTLLESILMPFWPDGRIARRQTQSQYGLSHMVTGLGILKIVGIGPMG